MSAKDIRNIVLLGHSGSGKTTLAESMLYLTGGTDRLGRIADGNTVCDYDPEEIRRQISISLAVAPVEYDSCKINVLDVPGGFDFAGEVAEAVQAADAAVIVCSAKAGMSVGAEKAWKYCEKNSLPRLLYISKTDEENSDYNAAFNTLRERFGKNIAPVVAPIWDESKKVIGIIDVLHKRAFEFGPGGGRVEIEVPENKKPVLDELYDALKESVAETSEEFMEKFFAGEDFTYAEMIHGLRQGVKDLSLFPVVCGSAIQGMGTRILMDTIVELLPQPQDARALMAENEDGESSEFVVAPGALPTAFVFKTISDQYGKYSYVKVLSGSIKPDMPMVNARTGETEKLGRLYIPKGKKYTEVKELTCGDIGAIAKMDKVKTGDTLCEPRKVVKIEPIPFDEPCYSVAIAPKTRGQEDKMAQGLNRLNEEDPSFRVVNNAETHQMSSPVRATSRSTCSSTSSRAASASRSCSTRRACPTVKRSARRSPSRAVIRSRPAAAASSATFGSASSPTRRAKRWSSPRKSSAAASPRTSSPRSKRVCARPASMARSRVIPS